MAVIALDIPAFRAVFAPAFDSTATYPNIKIETMWDVATAYISDKLGGCYCGTLSIKQQTYALQLMTAHLLYINNLVATGQTPGITTGATIDKVSVTMLAPPADDNWKFWLNQSPYGQQLLALLQGAAVGGFYIGGAPEIGALRRVGGLAW